MISFLFVQWVQINVQLIYLHLFLFFFYIGIPSKKEKTVWPTTSLIIYGIEIDSVNMVSRLPEQKVIKIRMLLHKFSKRKKVK